MLLGGCATALILWTLGRELDRAKSRHAEDMMDALAGHLELALGSGLEAWPEGVPALHGPGTLPEGDWTGARPLAEVLPPGSFVPSDPWERAYVVVRDADGRARLSCGGPDGRLETADGDGLGARVLG